MEFKSDALLLKAADYGENDKLVTLFTLERGKIVASMKGVKKANAKLKFAAQPFAFAEYVFATRAGRYTVVSAALHEGFYGLREDISAFYAAACVLEICDTLLFEGMENERLFVSALKALKDVEEGEPMPALLAFFLTALKEAGYHVSAGDCPVCGKKLRGRMAFDMRSGCFTCADCSEGVPASESTYRAVRAIGSGEESTSDGQKRALRLLDAYFSHQTEGSLTSLKEYLRLAE